TRAIKKSLGAMKKLEHRAKRECDRDVRHALEKAARLLRAALDDDDADRDDRDDRDDRPPPCWRRGDPGCGRTKNGNYAMDRAAFDAMVAAVAGAKPHVFVMLDQVKAALGAQYMTS